jgi:hypothetical protein
MVAGLRRDVRVLKSLPRGLQSFVVKVHGPVACLNWRDFPKLPSSPPSSAAPFAVEGVLRLNA